jgi:hypothetical protein
MPIRFSAGKAIKGRGLLLPAIYFNKTTSDFKIIDFTVIGA